MRRFERVNLADFSTLSRRDLFKGLGLGAAYFLAESSFPSAVLADPVFRHFPFSLGVASGEPSADGFVVWTKLAPQPLEPNGGMPMRAVPVSWEVAEDNGFRKIVAKGETLARPEVGHAVHVEVAGLTPAREYFYRFRAGRERSAAGRAKTLPAIGADLRELRFAVAGCQRYEDGHYTAWRHLADENLDFVFHYGDYIYEYRALRAGERAPPIVRAMPGNLDEIYTLSDYRHRYALHKLDPDLQAAHASAPFLASFDDHEVDNNWADMVSEEAGIPAEIFALRRIAGFQAWYEHMPLRAASRPNGAFIQAYRRFAFGNLAHVDVLDTRQYRSDQPCGDGWHATCKDAKDPARTILGQAQEAWLSEGLKRRSSKWTVLAQQVPIARLDRNPDPTVTDVHMDKWDGAEAARDRLFAELTGAKINNVVAVCGDVHHNRAALLKTDFDNPNSKTVGVEFVSTSITSEGDGVDQSPYGNRLLQGNAHLRYFNAQRGYVRHIVTPERWQADYRLLEKVSVPGMPIRTAKSLVVEAGKPDLNPV